MQEPAAHRLIHYEVHALRGDRWLIDAAALDRDDALAEARHLLRRPDVQGVRVWKELYWPARQTAAGRFILKELKPKPERGWRKHPSAPPFASPSMPRPQAAARVRRPMPAALGARKGDDWPLAAWLSFGAGAAALLLLTGLAALP